MLLYTKWMELPAITFKSRPIKDNVLYTVKRQCKPNIAPAKMTHSSLVNIKISKNCRHFIKNTVRFNKTTL